MNDLKIKTPETGAQVELPSIGVGTMRTSATYAALFVALEGDRDDRISVLSSVLELLKIHPDELEHFRKMPDVCHEERHEQWMREAEAIHDRHFG